MKTIEQIRQDLAKSSKRKMGFYKECLRIVQKICYNKDYGLYMGIPFPSIEYHLKSTKKNIKVILARRKESGDKKLYHHELKQQRRYLRGLKYLLT